MDALLLLYNLIMIILHSLPILLAAILYHKEKLPLYRYLIALFSVYMLDSLVLYLSDFAANFSAFYTKFFFEVPTLKTAVYAVSFFCCIKILECVLHYTTPVFLYIIYVAVIVLLLFIPGMDHSLFKLGLYYIPPSIFCISNGLYALHQYRNIPRDSWSEGQRFFRFVIYTMLLFSVLVLLEDLLAFAHYTTYLDLKQRSVSEDLLTILYSIYAITYLIKRIDQFVGNYIDTDTIEGLIDEALPETARPEPIPSHSLSKFYLFCKEYQLTTREQDIMTLLLKNMSNEEIRDELQISLGTVKAHSHNIYLKTGVKKRQQLIETYEDFDV